MANTLLLKKSGDASEAPAANELLHGELAINYNDGKLFFKNAGNSVVEFLSSPGTGAGQVLFSNGSTMAGDSTFFYDDANNRLGIGTATPGSLLEVKGTSDPEIRVTGTSTSAYLSISRAANTNDSNINFRTAGSNIWNIGMFGGQDDDSFYIRDDDNAYRFTVQQDGKIGIGTNNPGNNLDILGAGAVYTVIGSSNAGGASLILDGDSNGDGAGGDYSYFAHNTDGTLDIIQDSPSGTNEIRFGTAGTADKVVIDASGNVGIGITSPVRDLVL